MVGWVFSCTNCGLDSRETRQAIDGVLKLEVRDQCQHASCLSVDVTSLQGFLIENHSKRSSVFGLLPSIVAWTPLQRVWVCGVTKDVSPRCFTSQQHRKLTTSFNGFFFPSHHVRLLCNVSVCRLLKVWCCQKSLRVMEKSLVMSCMMC